MTNIAQPIIEQSDGQLVRLGSSYRRLAASRLPINLYGSTGAVQRRAAELLHGMEERASSWEELDGHHLADDLRGDRASLLLGGATGVAAPHPSNRRGLFASAGTGTLFLTNLEKLSPAAQHVLCRFIETGRYTPVGDPYPRPITCRIITATTRPLSNLSGNSLVELNLVHALGHITLAAEEVTSALEVHSYYHTHPSRFAAAS
jgi:transcriptional regulator with AAA-type ATPase domain